MRLQSATRPEKKIPQLGEGQRMDRIIGMDHHRHAVQREDMGDEPALRFGGLRRTRGHGEIRRVPPQRPEARSRAMGGDADLHLLILRRDGGEGQILRRGALPPQNFGVARVFEKGPPKLRQKPRAHGVGAGEAQQRPGRLLSGLAGLRLGGGSA